MNKNMGKRIGCAALAAQMLLMPVAEAAAPLRTLALAGASSSGIESQSEREMERFLSSTEPGQEEQTFPHVNVPASDEQNKDPAGQTPAGNGGGAAETTPAPKESSSAETTPAPKESPPAETTTAPKESPPAETTTAPKESPPAETTTAPKESPPAETTTAPEESPPAETTTAPKESPPAETTTAPKESPPAETTPVPEVTPPVETPPANEVLQRPLRVIQKAAAYSPPQYAPVDHLAVIYGFGPQYGATDTTGQNPVTVDPYKVNTKYPHADYNLEYDFGGADWYKWAYEDGDQSLCMASDDDAVTAYAERFSAWYNGDQWNYENDSNFDWDPATGKTYFEGHLLPTADRLPRVPNREFSGEWYLYGGSDWGQFSSDCWLDEYESGRDERFDPARPMDDYLSSRVFINGEYWLRVIGKWDPSSNASLTGLALNGASKGSVDEEPLKLYPVTSDNTVDAYSALTAADLKTKTPADTDLAVEKDKVMEQTQYYIRVPEEVDGLTFDLKTYEPDSTIEIRSTFAGEEKAVYNSSDSERMTYSVTAKFPKDSSAPFPGNSVANPARGEWRSTDSEEAVIPLESVDETAKYNVVTITVTPPSGKTGDQKTYTFYVQRLAKARLELKPGNMPLGMIERDTTWNDTQKATAKTAFENNPGRGFNRSNSSVIPPSPINNDGWIQQDGYLTEAWLSAETNLDESETAIVVYQNTVFQEPGFYLYDGTGNRHDGATGIDVQWELTLTTVDKLGPDVASDSVTGDERSWSGTGDVTPISLVGDNIKPGVYTLQYTYKDAYDETVYSDKGFSRTVLVLPLRGDVDMDGAVTPADGVELQKLLDSGYFDDVKGWTCTDSLKYIYTYRVCDVNGFRGAIVTQEDVDLLLGAYEETLAGQNCNYFYLPLPGGEEKPRSPASENSSSSRASIGLSYLGVGTDADSADSEAKVNYVPEDNSPVFWMEARLQNADTLPSDLQEPLTSLTFTVTYDSAYVNPFLPEGASSWGDYILSQNPQWSGWTVRDGKTEITPTGRDFKATNSLEALVGSSPKELRFSLTPPRGAEVTLADGALLRLPFQLKAFPAGKFNDSGKMIELALGPRDLTVATTAASTSWRNGDSSQMVTSVTENLAELLDYSGSQAVPLGEDKTPCAYVYHRDTGKNFVYGATGTSYAYGVQEAGGRVNIPSGRGYTVTHGRLPAGMQYNNTTGTLSGCPTEAGTFDFQVTGSTITFRLVVEQLPLTLTATDVTKFYGETETTKQTFTYDKTQIDLLDLERVAPAGGTNDGSAEDLAALMGDGYEAPTIRLVTSITNQTAVTADTVPGDYTVLLQGGKSKNYKFQFAQNYGTDTAHPELGTAKLTIKPRPLLVGEVTKDPLETLWENEVLTEGREVTVQYNDETTDVTFADLTDYVDSKGYYKDPDTKEAVAPLTPTKAVVGTDAVELKVKYDVTKNEHDPASGFNLKETEETRAVDVYQAALTAGSGQSGNYTLAKNEPSDRGATVKVKKRVMTQIAVRGRPTMTYLYGQELLLTNLILDISYQDSAVPVEVANTLENFGDAGLTLQWVAENRELPTEDSPRVQAGEQLDATTGKYICITGTGDDPARAWVGPFVVQKRDLKLTIHSASRYYGEEIGAALENWTVTYDPRELATWDQDGHTGDIADLTTLSDYTAPTVLQVEEPMRTARPVNKTTSVGTSYYALLTGAESRNYRFQYTCTSAEGSVSPRPDYGYAPLKIERRPILVTKIAGSPGALFHDSDTNVIAAATASAGNGAEELQAALPVAGQIYYNTNGTTYQTASGQTLTGKAVCDGDTVSAIYRATFQQDSTERPYFRLEEGVQYKKQPVTVTEVRLQTGARNDNYQLIYPNWNAAQNGWAGSTAAESVTEGDIYRRRILDFEILNPPKKTQYVYGETLWLEGLQVRIRYEDSDGGTKIETVKYSEERQGDEWKNTFSERGLTVSWSVSGGAAASNGQQLSVARHHGKRLVVTGPQYPGETATVRTVSTPINVLKSELTLTVTDISGRYYGEDNGTYRFTFDADALAEWDRTTLGSIPAEGSATEQNTPATSAALQAINAPYEEDGGAATTFVGPQFRTEAGKTTPVREAPYTLELVGGSMANYQFRMVSGDITIVKRPIRVTGVVKNPLYRISSSVTGTPTRTTTCYEGTFGRESYHDLTLVCESGRGLTGDALVPGDGVAVGMTLRFPGMPNIPAGEYERSQTVFVWNFTLLTGGSSGNYELLSDATESHGIQATAVVYKRNIQSIALENQPSKWVYTYGEDLDLSGLRIRVTYEDGATWIGPPEECEGVYINYLDSTSLPDKERLPSLIDVHPAQTGDHLTIAKDSSGFAQNGKYLMISARTHSSQPFVDPILVTGGPIRVNPLELQYTLSAQDKDYDGNRKTGGTITLTNVYPGDQVWVKNGTDYNDSPLPPDYAFPSGVYNNGVTFTFTDENVRYRVADPANDIYTEVTDIPVEVTNIALDGGDRENYHINDQVRENTVQLPGRDGVPTAVIRPIHRDAPEVSTELWVDEHTNTVVVRPEKPALTFGDSGDRKNSELHYEYALVYEDEEGTLTVTDYQDSPYFGGEKVELEIPQIEGGTATPSGHGQTVDREDENFGSRATLPRGTYFGALVRLAKTNNYEVSSGTASFGGSETDMDALKTDFEAAVAAAEAVTLPEPENDRERQVERVAGPVIKTYTQRIDLASVTQERDAQGKRYLIPALEEVWFTDTETFERTRDMDRLLDNITPTRYYGYYWNPEKTKTPQFPLDLNETIEIEYTETDEEGNTQQKTQQVCGTGTVCFYVSVAAPPIDDSKPKVIKLDPRELTLWGRNSQAKLTAEIIPARASNQELVWTSSDESVALVSQSGVVTAVGSGTATITVSIRRYPGINDSITVTVQASGASFGGGAGGVGGGSGVSLPVAGGNGYDRTFMELYNGRFEPEQVMTRGQAALVISRFLPLLGKAASSIPSQYTDIPSGTNYASAVRELDRQGIMSGVGEGLFAPEQGITRAEVAAIFGRMLELPLETDPAGEHAFLDAGPENTWAWAYIDALAKVEITYGVGNGQYAPDRVLTRAEMAAFLARALATKVDNPAAVVKIPSDVPEDYWAYECILQAVNETQRSAREKSGGRS